MKSKRCQLDRHDECDGWIAIPSITKDDVRCTCECHNSKHHAPETAETIDHPAHYGGPDNPYEAIKVIRAWKLGFCLGNTLKYICRAGKKPGADTLEDLKKAQWYLAEAIKEAEAQL